MYMLVMNVTKTHDAKIPIKALLVSIKNKIKSDPNPRLEVLVDLGRFLRYEENRIAY